MKRNNKHFYRFGLLHKSHSKSEHWAGYVTYGSLFLLLLLLILVGVDEIFLGSVIREYIFILGKLGLVSFAAGCVLTILATNKLI